MKYFHRQKRGLEPFLHHRWIVNALKGVTRSYIEGGTKPRKCRPVAWSVLLASESLCSQWEPGGRVLWPALRASFLFQHGRVKCLRARKDVDDGHILRRGDVVIFRGST